jgi:hypothetical protein
MHVSIELPDITDYPKGFPQYWVKSVFVRTVSANYQVNALASTYVRLVEAALVEYRLGGAMLREFWGTHTSFNLGAIHRSVSHFESCLSNMYRAINCFRRLRRHRSRDALCVALNEKSPAFATASVAEQIHNMRHEIHHLEELVMDGRLQEGQPTALLPDGPETPHPTEPNQTLKSIDRLVIAGRELKFADLARWLTEMARHADRIAQFEPNSAPA